eukprot:280137_1
MPRQKQEFKNQDADTYLIESDDEECERILNLSRQNLRCIPYKVVKEKSNNIHTLILSSNKLCSFRYLTVFSSLTTLQLDSNHLSDELFAYFPRLKRLNTLWLNNNNLRNLDHLLSILRSQCPRLEYLSLLFNPLCPFTEDDDEYHKYRHKVLSHLPSLKYLDNCKRSKRRYGRSRARQQDILLVLSVIDINVASLVSSILHETHMKRIIYQCATITHYVEWRCFYKAAHDGFSKHTFAHEVSKIDGNKSLLIVRDTSNYVFGAYIDGASWCKSLHYKGSCNCFVFHFGGHYANANHNLYIHKATACEPYYLHRNHKSITIGRGGAAAIYFDMDFSNGTTTYCKTFNSPPLTPRKCFAIQSIEIWAPLFD